MKKVNCILKYTIYYIIGLLSFSTIAFITQRIAISVLLETLINPIQDLYNIRSYIYAYFPYYIITYSLLHFSILYLVRKYDKYIVNKLNERLKQLKKFE